MTLDACYDALGLVGPVTRREAQRAYKRLVLKYHPDRCPDDPVAGERFRRATEAYAIIKTLHEKRSRDAHAGPCHRCHRIDVLLRGIHGKLYCPACLLGQRRRLLPLPVYRTIRCLPVIGLQLLGVWNIALSFQIGSIRHAVIGMACGLASVVALGVALGGADLIER